MPPVDEEPMNEACDPDEEPTLRQLYGLGLKHLKSKIFSKITFFINSFVRRIVDTIVMFFPSTGLQLTMIQPTNPFDTWMMKNFGFPFSFGQYSLLNLLASFFEARERFRLLTLVCLAPNPALCSQRK